MAGLLGGDVRQSVKRYGLTLMVAGAAMGRMNVKRAVMWLVAAAVLTSNVGCRQILMARSRAAHDREAATAKQAIGAFNAEFKSAFDDGRWQDAAATFTPERAVTLKRYGAWRGNMERLWYRLRGLARSSAGRRDFGRAVALCEVMDAVPVEPRLRRSIDAEKAENTTRRNAAVAHWNEKMAPAKADEAAGRPACAAARYAAAYGAPDDRTAAATRANVCDMIAKAAAPWVIRVHVAQGSAGGGAGQAALMASMRSTIAAAVYGPSVKLVDDAKIADVTIIYGLGPERVEKTTKVEQRRGQYVSGKKRRPNPKIPELRKEIAALDKEAKWQRATAARIKCSSGPCKSRIAALNSAKRAQDRRNSKAKQLASTPAMANVAVRSEMTYKVTLHVTTLVQPVLVETRTKAASATRPASK